jgi:hypothetical protein
MKPRSFAFAARWLVALMPVAACTSCMGFLDMDPYWHHPNNAIDRGIDAGGTDERMTIEKIRFEFENHYPDPKSAEGLKNYLVKLGDTCETREMIVCTHRINFSMYVYKYFFDIYLGKSEQSRTKYLVRISFPKEGDNVIPKLAIDVRIEHINDP